MYFVWIWEQTAIISLYSINWLVFITETECVYCAVRTGSLYVLPTQCIYVFCVDLRTNSDYFPIQQLTGFYNRDGVCLLRGTDWIFIRSAHTVYLCILWIWEQTAIISLCSINWLVFITGTECLLRGTDWIFIYNSVFCPHSVFMCFVWIWEQTAIISLYSINWLVIITETVCVYCAVRAEYTWFSLLLLFKLSVNRQLSPCSVPFIYSIWPFSLL